MDTLEAITSRRSVRSFTGEPVKDGVIEQVLEAGRWAPSGLNNQPWRFKVLRGEEKDAVAEHTKYGHIIEAAPACIAVFLDGDECYDRTKDLQSAGACIQNMLLAAHSLGLGAVWLGEILNQREEVEKQLGVSENLELMAVVALGHPAGGKRESERRPLRELLVGGGEGLIIL